METPIISIIVPVYNVREYLNDCLDSLMRQNYPKIEIILVDDGSTDGSGVDCDTIAKKDSRIKVVHQQNQGLSAARNRGIKEASGNYITFVDSDDAVSPDYVQYMFSLITKYQAKMAICAIREITVKGNEINYGADYVEKVMSTEETLGRMLREEGFNVSAYAKLYRRDLWDNVAFPEGSVHEDLGTTYKLVEKCPRIAYGEQPKYIYKKRELSISNSDFSDKKFDIIELTDKMCDDIEKLHPYLKNTTDLRRMHARFSVLRQMASKKLTPIQAGKEQEIVEYLKTNRKFVTKNPVATKRDKIAMQMLLANKEMFKIGWKAYSKLRP
ncbi:glycosyltransferase family 2 protein [Candidatus Saccharibacteria bacterium]|nr:glycosyltransferase family 2 protein [Candidatus Saccharibacteria bacterium]